MQAIRTEEHNLILLKKLNNLIFIRRNDKFKIKLLLKETHYKKKTKQS